MNNQKNTVTFIVPGDNRSGGVRVTVCMANCLLARGNRVRIVHPVVQRYSVAWWRALASRALKGQKVRQNSGWLADFKGQVEGFGTIKDIHFAPREIVISVGTLTIRHLEALRGDVIKLRYNHGLLENMSAEDIRLWSLRIPTITVSRTIMPDLEAMSKEPVLAAVPNGIDTNDYRPLEGVARNAIGTIYSSHPAKAPELLPRLMQEIHRLWPEIPQVVFGTEAQPPSLAHAEYHRLPSVDEARMLYNRAKIWLVPSHTEGFPGPLVEAMACRCCVISTDTYGGREIIRHGENGLLVPRGDLPAFITQIRAVLDGQPLLNMLADGGLRTARTLTWDAAADKMEQVLLKLQSSPV